jgi:hypothetical protein
VTTALVLGLIVVAPAAGAQVPAGCQTYDEHNNPATLFSPGDRIIVSGQGFPSGSEVKIDYLQATLVPRLTSLRADDTGAFASAPMSLPAEGYAGSASVRAAAGGVAATCAIEIVPRFVEAKPVDTDIVLVWGSALAVGALVLAMIVWRRRRASRREGDVERRMPISVLMPATDVHLEDDDVTYEEEEEEEHEPELAQVGAGTTNVSSTVARLMAAAKSWNER